jgi:hypothetical protein
MLVVNSFLKRDKIRGFALRFLLYSIILFLLGPWLFPDVFTSGIMVAGRAFEHESPHSARSFGLAKEAGHSLNARIIIVNPSLLNPDGSGPERHLDFDAIGVFWSPCALILSLFLASPFSWKWRILGILVGIPLLLIAIYLEMRFLIWDESSFIGLASIPEYLRGCMTVLRRIVMFTIGCTFPISLWLTAILAEIKASRTT